MRNKGGSGGGENVGGDAERGCCVDGAEFFSARRTLLPSFTSIV